MALSPLLRKNTAAISGKYNRSSGDTVKPKEGRNYFRILQPTNPSMIGPKGEFWRDSGVHWIKSEPNGKPVAVVGCQEIVNDEPCDVCAMVQSAIHGAVDEETKKFFSEQEARRTVFVNAINRTDNSEDVIVLELSPTTWGKVWELILAYDEAGQDILDLKDGIDVMITRSGKGLNTEYSVAVRPATSKPVAAEKLDECHDLKEFIEKKFFRGDERKAISAISQVSGVPLPSTLGAPSSLTAKTPAPALTANTAVEDADEPEVAAETAPVEEEATPPETPPETTTETIQASAEKEAEDLDAMLAKLDG